MELGVYGSLAYGTVCLFGLEVDWEKHSVESRTSECQGLGEWWGNGGTTPHFCFSTAFTFHQFSQWLKTVTLPTMWLGAASLTWELLTALWR